mgnify:FL=1
MPLTRRQFLTLMGGSAGAAVLFQACGIPEKELLIDSSVEMPEDLVTGLDNWYATTFQDGLSSQGIVVRIMEGRAKKVEGNTDHPLNRGAHSAQAEAMLQALYHPDRISSPLVRTGTRGSGEFREISWEDAIARLASVFDNLSDTNKALMLTDIVNGNEKLVLDKFVSSTGIRQVTFEPVEHTNLLKAVDHVFGQKNIPDFDIDNASLILSFGCDFLDTWVSPTRYSRGYGQFRQGHHHRGKLIHIESRFSTTAANADEWVYVNPGTEGMVAMSIMHEMASHGEIDTSHFSQSDLYKFEKYTPEFVSSLSGVSVETIQHIAEEFSHSDHPLAIGGDSASAHTNGLQNLIAIYSLNLAVNNIGKSGGIIFNPEPPIAGLESNQPNSSQELMTIVDGIKSGDIELLLVKDADLYYGLPDSMGFKNNYSNVPMIVSFGNMMDDTTSIADLILPQNSLFEDWGTDVPLAGPGYQTVGFQQPVVRPYFESRGQNLGTKGFSDVLMTTAQVMNVDLELGADTYKDVLQNTARELYELNRGDINGSKYSSFQSFWNALLARGGWWDHNYKSNHSFDFGGLVDIDEPSFHGNGSFYLIPFYSSAFHDGKYAYLPWVQNFPDPLSTAVWETWVEMNYKEAESMNISEGDVIEIRSSNGLMIKALAWPNPATPPGILGVPMGQGHRDGGRYSSGRGSNVLSVLGLNFDSQTGALAWSSTKVNITASGENIRLPKLENSVPDFPRDEHNHVVEITNGKSSKGH